MKHYKSGRNLNESIMKGVDALADAVGATLGPRGRNVILKGHNTKPLITKDGVTVARFVEFEDPFENLGAQVIKQASEVTNTSAGDGTTKPQDDDIMRSKTIAKVTSTTVSTTYSDGSYCVPCVLMAC